MNIQKNMYVAEAGDRKISLPSCFFSLARYAITHETGPEALISRRKP